MKHLQVLLVSLLILIVVATCAWIMLARDRPPAEPQLTEIRHDSLDDFRADFNRSSNQTRVILLLSPT